MLIRISGQNTCGERVRHYRLLLENPKFPGKVVSQEVLAAIAQSAAWDIGRDVIAKIELGERCVTDEELQKLAWLLKCSVHDLLQWDRKKTYEDVGLKTPKPFRGIK
jgi:hypothetical protein